jgi:hypothetical protein
MKNIQPFVMVNNDLLATPRLSSTQKLFISYIIGWQKSGLSCKMTNRNLAEHFGMKYAGIRSMLNKLNTYKFFETTQFGHTVDNSSWTSGHEIKVDESKLVEFLNAGKSEKKEDIEEVSSIGYNEDEIEQLDYIERLNAIKEGIEILRPLELMLINEGSIIRYKGMISPLDTVQESIDNVDCINDAFLKEMEVDLLIVTEVLESKKRILDLTTNYSEPQMEEEVLAENPVKQEETLKEPEQIIFQEETVDDKEILINDGINEQENQERIDTIKEGIRKLRPLESMLKNEGLIKSIEGNSLLDNLQKSINSVDCIDDVFLGKMEKDLLNASKFLESKKWVSELLTMESDSQEEEEEVEKVVITKSDELSPVKKYQDNDIIKIRDVMEYLGFNNIEIIKVQDYFDNEKVTFYDLDFYLVGQNLGQKWSGFTGLRVTEEQMSKLKEIRIEEPAQLPVNKYQD